MMEFEFFSKKRKQCFIVIGDFLECDEKGYSVYRNESLFMRFSIKKFALLSVELCGDV